MEVLCVLSVQLKTCSSLRMRASGFHSEGKRGWGFHSLREERVWLFCCEGKKRGGTFNQVSGVDFTEDREEHLAVILH